MKPVIYISGPMTGLPELNYPAFHAAAKAIEAAGFAACNPAENHQGRTDLPHWLYLAHDLRALTAADAMLQLDGWRYSVGAKIEWRVARAIGLPIVTSEDLDRDPHGRLAAACEFRRGIAQKFGVAL